MIIKSTFKVTLEDEDGKQNAVFVFKKPKANKFLNLSNEETDIKKQFFMLTDDLLSVEGLYHENGESVSVDEIKDLDLDFNTLNAIITGYNLGAFPKKPEDEKKSSSKE